MFYSYMFLTAYACLSLQLKAGGSILTVMSHEAKKKQHAFASSGLRDHYSELFTWMEALKFKNAVTQPL